LLYNTGDAGFVEMADGLGLGDNGDGRALAFGDFDQDGDSDIALSRYLQKSALYMNGIGQDNNFIAIRLSGDKNNKAGVGAIISVESGGKKVAQQVTVGSGFSSQSSTEKIFGLAQNKKVESVSVLWPEGEKERFFDLAINQRHLLKKGTGQKSALKNPEQKKKTDSVVFKYVALGMGLFASLIALLIILRRKRS